MSDAETTENSQVTTKRPICGFWRRIFAFSIDGFILGVLGMILSIPFSRLFILMGGMGPLVGYVVCCCYYGIFSSNIGNGQTIGSRLFGICVVGKDGNLIGVKRAFVRAAIMSVIVFNGVPLEVPQVLGSAVSGLLMAVYMGLIYFYLFNRKTRQSLHDLVCGTFVYKVKDVNVPTNLKIASVHYKVYGVLLLLLCCGVAYISVFISHTPLYSVYKKELTQVYGVDGVYAASVGFNESQVYHLKNGVANGPVVKLATATVYVNKMSSYEATTDKIVRIMINDYPDIQEVKFIDVNVCYGYNIGIARSYTIKRFYGTTQQWREKLKTK